MAGAKGKRYKQVCDVKIEKNSTQIILMPPLGAKILLENRIMITADRSSSRGSTRRTDTHGRYNSSD
jgi:hypothetical protein